MADSLPMIEYRYTISPMKTPNDITRRDAMKGLAAGAVAASVSSSVIAKGANERIVIGAIGLGGRGRAHARLLAERKDAEVAYVCDPDLTRAEKAAAEVEKAGGKRPKVVQDLASYSRGLFSRRHHCGHSGSLARAGHYTGLRSRKTCLCRETLLA